jgi:hypothetical protein
MGLMSHWQATKESLRTEIGRFEYDFGAEGQGFEPWMGLHP